MLRNFLLTTPVERKLYEKQAERMRQKHSKLSVCINYMYVTTRSHDRFLGHSEDATKLLKEYLVGELCTE